MAYPLPVHALPGALALLSLTPFLQGPQDAPPNPEESAAEQLLRAEEVAREGDYAEARRRYARVVERFPGTKAAVVARRRSRPSAFLGWADLVRHGPSANRIDVVILGEGYQLDEQRQFDELAEDVPGYFARERTLREYFPYFNFLRANLVSAENGVDGFGRDYDTALGGFTLPTYAGHVGVDPAEVQLMMDELPEHDRLAIVFVRNGVAGTARPGIATIGGRGIRTIIHEWGHAFGRLVDEYATKTHDRGGPRGGVNVALSEDPAEAPWAHWLQARVPGIGLYEGASGQVRDAWRPTASGCIMNDGEFFCRVCQEALVLAIYARVDPIDACYPPAPESGAGLLLADEPLDLRVRVLQPASHDLEVDWWVVSSARAPSTPGGARARAPARSPEREASGERGARGPLPTMDGPPWASTRPDGEGVHHLRLRPSQLEPGRYRVTVRVRDTTRWRGERWPWVLKDERGLLESERAWWLVVLRPR